MTMLFQLLVNVFLFPDQSKEKISVMKFIGIFDVLTYENF